MSKIIKFFFLFFFMFFILIKIVLPYSFSYEKNLTNITYDIFSTGSQISQNISLPNRGNNSVNISYFEGQLKNITPQSNGININFGSSYQGITFSFLDICKNSTTCLITNATRIIFDLDCTSNTLGSSDRKALSGFVTSSSINGFLPYNLDYAFYFLTKSDLISQCRLIESPSTGCIDGYKRFNFSIQEFINSDSSCILSNNTLISKFILSTEYNGADKEILSYLKIENIETINNSLPKINSIEFKNYSVCLNSSNLEDEGYNRLDVNVTDAENNTIFYSYTNQDEKTDFYSVYYQDRICVFGICSIYPNFDFLTKVSYRNNTNCLISNETMLENANKNYIKEFLGKKVLYLQSSCIGEKEFNYRLDRDIKNVFYDSTIYGLDNNEEFNFTLYNEGYENETTKIIFKNTNNKLEIYNHEKVLMLNLSMPEELEFTIHEFSNNTNVIAVSNVINGVALYNKTFNDTSSFVSLRYTGSMYQKDFHYSGVAIIPNWSNINFTTIKYDNFGLVCVDVLVTDNINKMLDRYSKKESCFMVTECQFIVKPITDEVNPITITKKTLGKGLKAYFDKVGIYELGKTAIWWLFFIMFFILLIIKGFNRGIGFPLFASGTICLLLSYWLEYTNNVIAFLIIIAFSLASLFSSHQVSNIGG